MWRWCLLGVGLVDGCVPFESGTGVRERMVSTPPAQPAPVLLGAAVERGALRIGGLGSAAAWPSGHDARPPNEGARQAPGPAGGGWVGVGLGNDAEVAATVAVSAPGRGEHLPFTPRRATSQRYGLEVRQVSDQLPFLLQWHLGVRVYRIPYTWDAGDCFEVDGACLAWDRKAGPVSGTAWRPGAQVGVTYWRDLGYGLGLVVGTQVELLPAMDTADRANFQCNSLGQCELGQRPSFFGTSLAVSPDLYFGALWDPLRWLGVRVVVTPWSGPHDGPSQWLATQVSLEIRP